jgi:hypothetical protein
MEKFPIVNKEHVKFWESFNKTQCLFYFYLFKYTNIYIHKNAFTRITATVVQ